jgi:uncharacterized protein (TIGR00369 family)
MTTALAIAALRGGGRDIALDMLPYAHFLGVRADVDGDDVRLVMPFDEQLIGAPGRLHGGAVAGLLELAGVARLLVALGDEAVPPLLKPVTVTVDYLREGRAQPTFAAATLTRLGRRIANLHVLAWQYDHGRPIASANLNILLDRG